MRAVLLPVKDPIRAKQRLSGFLEPKERYQLAWAMLRDVAQALCGSQRADRIMVVARDPDVRAFARSLGWECMPESEQASESISVDLASLELKRRGVSVVLRLPGDIPLVTSADVDGLLEIAPPAPAAVLVPSSDGRGTNALLRTPPDVFPARFGPNSLRLHELEARRAGATFTRAPNRRIALDLDEPTDLIKFLEHGPSGATSSLLRSLDVKRRFEHVLA